MADTKKHNIYLIDPAKACRAAGTTYTQKTKTDSVVGKLAKIITADNKYKEQNLDKAKANINGFKARLFYYAETPENTLSAFYDGIAKPKEPILTDKYNSGSSILILWDDSYIFAIPTGRGVYKLSAVSKRDFGLTFGSLFSQQLLVSAVGKNELGGIVHSSSTVYSDEVRVADIQSMSAVARVIHADISDNQTADSLIPSDTRRKKSGKVSLKSSLQFGCMLNYQDLTELLKNIITYANAKEEGTLTELIDKINLLKSIPDGSSEHIELRYNFLDSFYKRQITSSENTYIPISSSEYLDASTYKIRFNEIECFTSSSRIEDENIKRAYYEYISQHSVEDSLDEFIKFITTAKIIACDENGETISSSIIFEQLSGEFTSAQSFYFIVEGIFYEFGNDLVQRIDAELNPFMAGLEDGSVLLGLPWTADFRNEDEYNAAISRQEMDDQHFFLFHRNLVDHIEFADILHYREDGGINIVHIKDKYDSSMRALSKQIELSVEKYLSFKRVPNGDVDPYINSLYLRVSGQNGEEEVQNEFAEHFLQVFPAYQDFANALSSREVTFVAAIRGVQNYANTHSTTAKYCLNELRKFCILKGVNFKVVSI